jgi:Bifunctional DNA primase/polymerase, N-terminal/AAA domain
VSPTATVPVLTIPDIDAEADTLSAALAYAKAGWYVGYTDPNYHDPKSPEVMGKGWQTKTSRDPQTIVGWYAGRKQLGMFLHAGRSGAWIADVDHPEHMPDVLADACSWAPYQSTRPDTPGRGHYLFRQPPGRVLGNSTGKLGSSWGEARGRNGVIVVWPTPHPDGGEYRWERIGTVLELPGPVAGLLTDTTPAEDAVTDDELTAFLQGHTAADRPQLLKSVTGQFTAAVAEGESRHDAAVKVSCWAMREAAAGFYPALEAATTLRDLYIESRGHDRDGGRGAVDAVSARTEYRSILAWAIGQVATVDLDELRTRVNGRVPDDATIIGNGNGTGENPAFPAVVVRTLEEFAAVNESGAEALLGDGGDAVIPAGGDVMVYGDGGAGKTTLCVDLACHLAAGDDWLGIAVARPLTVLLVENEGPRPLFRAKADRKVKGWAGSPLGGRVRIVEAPWATLSFAEETHRAALAQVIADHDCDLVVVGPLACSGMTEAGTLAEVRAFLALIDDVRRRSGRAVTFLTVHHPNRAGTPSGAWEGAVDTLLHVTGMGHGRTRLHVQKARWSSTWHATTLELNWTEGDSYEVNVKPELSDDDIADRILAAVRANPGTDWTKVEKAVTGVQGTHRRTIRDRLLTDRVLVNVNKVDGVLVALDHCRQGRPAHLHLASDPTIAHLRPDPDVAGTKSSSATGDAPTATSSLRPDSNRDEGKDEVAGRSPRLFTINQGGP